MILFISLSVLLLTNVWGDQMEDKLGKKLVAAKHVKSDGVALLYNVFLQVC